MSPSAFDLTDAAAANAMNVVDADDDADAVDVDETMSSGAANPQNSSDQIDKVCIVGSGNWGSAIATIIGRNCERLPYYETQVNMWVYEEMVDVDDPDVDDADGGGPQKKKLTEVRCRCSESPYLSCLSELMCCVVPCRDRVCSAICACLSDPLRLLVD